jgi:uncharacterized protein YqgV (UPF0045/DUF77 family)
MRVSIDISMYPLQDAYCEPILDFIRRVENHPKLIVEKNRLSTQIFGDYRTVMALVSEEMLVTLEQIPHTIFVLKIIGTDRSDVAYDRCE